MVRNPIGPGASSEKNQTRSLLGLTARPMTMSHDANLAVRWWTILQLAIESRSQEVR